MNDKLDTDTLTDRHTDARQINSVSHTSSCILKPVRPV